MRNRKAGQVAIATLSLAAASACAAAPRRGGETITISQRWWFGICAGICRSYDITVSPQGQVFSRTLTLAGNAFHTERFRVTLAEAAHFRTILLPFRPVGLRRTQAICTHDVRDLGPRERQFVRHVTEIQISWRGPRSSARLIGCENPQDARLQQAIWDALRVVHPRY